MPHMAHEKTKKKRCHWRQLLICANFLSHFYGKITVVGHFCGWDLDQGGRRTYNYGGAHFFGIHLNKYILTKTFLELYYKSFDLTIFIGLDFMGFNIGFVCLEN